MGVKTWKQMGLILVLGLGYGAALAYGTIPAPYWEINLGICYGFSAAGAALIVGTLTDRLKSQVKQSTRAAYRTNLLFETNQMLQKASTEEEIFQAAQTQLHKLSDRELTVHPGITTGGKQNSTIYLIVSASYSPHDTVATAAHTVQADLSEFQRRFLKIRKILTSLTAATILILYLKF